jgi:hypothetical protein
MKKLMPLLLPLFLVSLSLGGLSGAVTLQLTTNTDISGASQDASQNYYVTEGDSFTVEVDVLNPSSSSESATNIEATLSLPTGLSTTDSLTKTVSASLSPGSSADQSWTVSGDVAGNYLGQIEIATQGTNTAQNDDTTGVLVKSPATIVGGISCSATDSKVIMSDFDVTVTVQNLGDLEATGISIDLSSSPSDISISNPKTISSIDGGESGSKTYSSLSTTQSDTIYDFTATVTSDNAGSDTAECSAETVSGLPNGYVCTSSSHCTSGCCSGSLCKAAAVCDTDDGNGGGGGGGAAGVGGGGPSEGNSSRRPQLVPGVGLRNNLKLQAAIEKVLGQAQMSEQARENLMRLSESISSQVQMTRNFRSANRTSTMETRLVYSGSMKARNFMLFDKIPKGFAKHADNLTVTASGAIVEVVDADPEYLFTYPEMTTGQEVVITYSVGEGLDEDIIDSFAGEVYAQELVEPTAPTACTDGQRRCNGNLVEVCQADSWTTLETCELDCLSGQCQTSQPQALDTTLLIIIIVVAVVAVIALVFLMSKKKKSAGVSTSGVSKSSPEPLTPGEQAYHAQHGLHGSAHDRVRDLNYRFRK